MLEKNTFSGIDIYRSVYRFANTNMYAIIEGGNALIIDPHKNEELGDLLISEGVDDVLVILTHEHHDHTSGLYWYQEKFSAKFLVQKDGADWMASRLYVRPMFLTFLLSETDKLNGTDVLSEFRKDFVPKIYKADMTYDDLKEFDWCYHRISLCHIPGHSKGGSLIVFDGKIAFTGDTLFRDVPTTLRFPGGSENDFISVTIPLLNQKLSKDMQVLPGHGRPFILGEKIKNGKIDIQFK